MAKQKLLIKWRNPLLFFAIDNEFIFRYNEYRIEEVDYEKVGNK